MSLKLTLTNNRLATVCHLLAFTDLG